MNFKMQFIFLVLSSKVTFAGTKIIELEKIKVGIVNYLNTRPLIYGLERGPIQQQIELIGDYPARLSALLMQKEIDIGLVPVAILPSLKEYYIESEYCIGTVGEIASVALFSEVPLDEIETVLLDYQSQTSVALLQFLMKEYWGIFPQVIATKDESYRQKIKGTTAGLVIGDRAFEQRKISTFMFDLGSEWLKITGLPFVFAAWVSTKPLDKKFIREFDKANAVGISRIDEIVKAAAFPLFDLHKYYQLHLSYLLDAKKKKGMEMFLQYIQQN